MLLKGHELAELPHCVLEGQISVSPAELWAVTCVGGYTDQPQEQL